MTTLESALYREHIPNGYLSKTFQSSALHTPADTTRRTISTENYLRQIVKAEKSPKTPWGRQYSYGSLGFVQLQGTPHSLDMIKIPKGTHHFGSGASQKPRGVTVQQCYSITPTKKSMLRATDELIESPTKIDLTKEQIDKRFPAEHPYTSHIPKTNMFPSTTRPKHPINTNKKENSEEDFALPGDYPASAPYATIIGKARGTPSRHELISIPLDSRRKPMTWPQGPTYFQVLKGPDRERNVYYPIPPNQLNPNSLQFQKLSESTERALREANKSQWTTTYQRDFENTRSAVQNLDTEKLLTDITTSPNADVQTALLHKNTQKKNQEEIKRSVEELTSETERKRRVQFVDANSLPNKFERQPKKLSLPMYKSSRPYTSMDYKRTSEQNNYIITDRSMTAAATRINPEVPTAAEMLSATDLRRKFNATHAETIPDLRHSRDARKALLERRHYIPEANGTKSYILDGY